jgi:hypothetical protein
MFFFPKREPEKSAVSRSDLESAITDAVKNSDPGCASFVGVIIQRETPKSRSDTNWVVRGVKFGAADRAKSVKAIEKIVQRMQHDFRLSDDQNTHTSDSVKQAVRKSAD